MQTFINLKKNVKAEAEQSLTKRCALSVFRVVRAAAEYAEAAPSQLAESFNDIKSAWIESQPKKS